MDNLMDDSDDGLDDLEADMDNLVMPSYTGN
jgi:hypothetical protein